MKSALLLIVFLFLSIYSFAQQNPLSVDDLTKWNRITEKVISPDGLFVACNIEPWIGDPTVKLYSSDGDERASFLAGSGVDFSDDSRFMVLTLKTPADSVKAYKARGVKPDQMSGDKLVIYNLLSGKADTVDKIKGYKIPEKWSGWIAYQITGPVMNGKSDVKGGDRGDGLQSKQEEKGNTLILQSLATGKTDTIPQVTEYLFAEESPAVFFISSGNESSVRMRDMDNESYKVIYQSGGSIKQLCAGVKADRVAFISDTDTTDVLSNRWSLYYWDRSHGLQMAASAGSTGVPEGWIVNENARLSFGKKSGRLFFGTSPAHRQKDTMLLKEERADVDIWTWNEGKLHSAQVIDMAQDKNRTYTAVFHPGNKTVVQLADLSMPVVELQDKGDGDYALGLSDLPYQVQQMWEGDPERYDISIIDICTGERKLLKRNYRARPRFSPGGKYLYWYNRPDSSWYTYSLKERAEQRLTYPYNPVCFDEDNDVPNMAEPYRPAGWLKDDRAFLISDRYDIWSCNPDGKSDPVNLTVNGRKSGIRYRLLRPDREIEYIDASEKQLLMGFDERSKGSGYYYADFRKSGTPAMLIAGDYKLGDPIMAKDSQRVIFTKESFRQFPDVIVSDLSFTVEKQLTEANPQQGDYLWGSAELLQWTTLNGEMTEGVLYKPDGFDPGKKYPMIVNFYEMNSSDLFSHRIPEAHRSTIDYHYYTSNGYLVFNPDIHYRIGYPGESAYECVLSGVMMLIEKGFVDEAHIGAQGHSWGGYQTAYLATRTDIFAAIESGAPVVNMFSAYGGIRWESGSNRSMQYEHQQSRIGASIWEDSRLYFENSPLFFVDKINTPVLIMANDHDGAVPWWQGIEFFVAMRRLGKPAWMLNYCGEPHWPVKIPNKVDFQKRMSQFFGHYLKNEPMPEWMMDGIPAVDKEYKTGF